MRFIISFYICDLTNRKNKHKNDIKLILRRLVWYFMEWSARIVGTLIAELCPTILYT